MEIVDIQKEIMQLITLFKQNNKDGLIDRVNVVSEELNEKLDFAQSDDEIVLLGKCLKIVEDLKKQL
ncbi:hypothetical protein [Myroides injenensis]|uniref:hypothetical protein n=1 Tax=Myroides injenensis TaxID=1183151 RepID=UPI000287C8D6|nr:hypothetical protein [Myroides injenensis]